MSCGAFENGVLSQLGNQKCTQCAPCKDKPLDIKDYNIGHTAVIGVQSRDDCNNFELAMDYLMDNVKTKNKTYIHVSNAGGHGVFLTNPNGGFKNCMQAKTKTQILNEVFNGNAAAVKNIVQNCYFPVNPPATIQTSSGVKSTQ